jgi:hypothetical protein
MKPTYRSSASESSIPRKPLAEVLIAVALEMQKDGVEAFV